MLGQDDKQQNLTVPATVTETLTLAQKLSRAAVLAEWVATHIRVPLAVGFTTQFLQHFDTSKYTGTWAAELAQRFASGGRQVYYNTLELSPFAPPQRQISTARQGAMEWSSSPSQSRSGGSQKTVSAEQLARELMAHGWTVDKPNE